MTATQPTGKWTGDELFQAIRDGDLVEVHRLLDPALIDTTCVTSPGFSHLPLTVAVRHSQLSVVQALLAQGALPDGPADTPVSPLFEAATRGTLDIARALVAGGADIHRESLTQPLSPTGAAEYWSFQGQGQKDVAAYLRSLGGTNPYNDPNRPENQWDGHPGEWPIRLVEKALDARVAPQPYVRGEGADAVPLYSCRFDRKKWLFRLL